MHYHHRRTIKSVSIKKTRPLRCPVCGKRELFILLIGEQAGKLKQCKNCGYKHLDNYDDDDGDR